MKNKQMTFAVTFHAGCLAPANEYLAKVEQRRLTMKDIIAMLEDGTIQLDMDQTVLLNNDPSIIIEDCDCDVEPAGEGC